MEHLLNGKDYQIRTIKAILIFCVTGENILTAPVSVRSRDTITPCICFVASQNIGKLILCSGRFWNTYLFSTFAVTSNTSVAHVNPILVPIFLVGKNKKLRISTKLY